MNLKKYFLIAVVLLAATACKQEAKSETKLQKPDICEGNLLVHLGEHTLLVPRKDSSLSIMLEDGTELRQLNRSHPGYECHIDEIKNATRMNFLLYRISVIKEGYDHKGFKGKFGDIESQYIEAKKEGRVEIFPDGLEVINPEKIIYILPKDEFSTLKGYPVAYVCPTLEERKSPPYIGFCNTDYFDSNNLYVRYSFDLSQNLSDKSIEIENEIAGIERKQRKFLEDMLSAGADAIKNKNSVKRE